MSISCAKCGRTYDEELFAGGRTIHCACGARVGPHNPVRSDVTHAKPRFLADAMLGRLARWLRLMGFDTVYDSENEDRVLVQRAMAEGRILLTRDRRLPIEWRIEPVRVLASETTHAQLRELQEDFDLKCQAKLFSRCPRCNTPVSPMLAEEARRHIPPAVAREQTQFTRCPSCGRIFWAGSHTERVRGAVADL